MMISIAPYVYNHNVKNGISKKGAESQTHEEPDTADHYQGKHHGFPGPAYQAPDCMKHGTSSFFARK